jgi:diaminopimelate decarboxylase
MRNVGFNVLSENIHPLIHTLQEGAALASAHGHNITTFDVGGGIGEMAVVAQNLARLVTTLTSSLLIKPTDRIIFEPGRLIVGDVASLIVSVVGQTDDKTLIIDASAELLHFLSGQTPLLGAWLMDRRSSPHLKQVVLRGIWESDHDNVTATLPDNVIVGDRLLFLNSGAYVLSFVQAFSPYPINVVYVD